MLSSYSKVAQIFKVLERADIRKGKEARSANATPQFSRFQTIFDHLRSQA